MNIGCDLVERSDRPGGETASSCRSSPDSWRDLIQEIPAGHLRDGVMEQGGHVTGLMLLCRTLAAHYMRLLSLRFKPGPCQN